MIALFAGMGQVGMSLRAGDFALDLDASEAAIERERPALTFIAYPDNPAGNLFDADAIERINAANPRLVILDEAYAPFTDRSILPRLGEWPNLLVARTVSEMRLTGLRLGCLAGPPQCLTEIDKVRLPYNITASPGPAVPSRCTSELPSTSRPTPSAPSAPSSPTAGPHSTASASSRASPTSS